MKLCLKITKKKTGKQIDVSLQGKGYRWTREREEARSFPPKRGGSKSREIVG